MAAAELSARPRDNHWQVVRGVCIIAVIWIHTTSGNAALVAGDAANANYWLISRQVLDFPVAVFLFLSGYFARIGPSDPVGAWIWRRVRRLLVPFVIWSAVYTAVRLVREPGIGTLDAVVLFVTGNSAWHLYFIVVLLQFVLLTPMLAAAVTKKWAAALFVITPVWLGGIYAWTLSYGSLPDGSGALFPTWFALYYAGLWVKARGRDGAGLRLSPALALGVGALLLSVVECYLLLGVGAPSALAVSQFKASSILYAFAIIAIFLSLRRIRPLHSSALTQLGNDSYGIYFVHLLMLNLIQAVFYRLAVASVIPALAVRQLIELLAALGLSLVVIAVARRLLGPERAARLLGF